MQLNINIKHPLVKGDEDNWLPKYPNPADFRFDYYKLLENPPHGLGKLSEKANRNVAVIGTGAAGITTARELLRFGFNVTIYEASDRIGGRLYTEVNPIDKNQTGMEMGAMRMPFFPEPGSKNCKLEYYMLYESRLIKHGAEYSQFPNPGNAKGLTGIYLNNGYGPDSGQTYFEYW